jgi:hypothetical protein
MQPAALQHGGDVQRGEVRAAVVGAGQVKSHLQP